MAKKYNKQLFEINKGNTVLPEVYNDNSNLITEVYKSNVTCSNCGNKNHDYKDCTAPITSWGLILVDLLDRFFYSTS